MKPIVLKADENGNIVISAEEIQKMLDDAYNEGYVDGSKATPVITTPYYPDYPVYLNKMPK